MAKINLYNSSLYQNKEINTSGIAVDSSSRCSLIHPLNVKGGSQFSMSAIKCGFSQYKIHEYDADMVYLGAKLITLPAQSIFNTETKYFNLELSSQKENMMIDGAKISLEFESIRNHQKVFALCENKCLEETMTKEQIMYRLPRIAIATKSGEDPSGGTFKVYDNDIIMSPVPKVPMIIALMTDGWIKDEMINVTDISNLTIGSDGEQNLMIFDLKTEATRISVVYVIFP